MTYRAYIYSANIKICEIEYSQSNDGSFTYIFRPIYSAIDTIDGFHGIMGLDLSLRKKEYIRHNILPTFIYERCPTKKRENFSELVPDCDKFCPLRWLAKTDMRYFGDNLYVMEH